MTHAQNDLQSVVCRGSMTEAEHARVTAYIHAYHDAHGKFPKHGQILLRMLAESREVTYLDAVQYGLGSTFRSRLSDLRKLHDIESWDKTVPTRYGTQATVRAHRLGGANA